MKLVNFNKLVIISRVRLSSYKVTALPYLSFFSWNRIQTILRLSLPENISRWNILLMLRRYKENMMATWSKLELISLLFIWWFTVWCSPRYRAAPCPHPTPGEGDGWVWKYLKPRLVVARISGTNRQSRRQIRTVIIFPVTNTTTR